MMKSFFWIVLLSILVVGVDAQKLNQKDVYKNQGLFGIVRASVGIPLSVDHTHGVLTKELKDSKTTVYSLNIVGGYYLIPELSLGLGLGFDGFHDPQANTFPVYGDIRYYVNDVGNSWYGMLNYGKCVKLNDNFRKGNLIRLGLGYKFFIGKTCLLADMHYGESDISLDDDPPRKTQYSYTYKQIVGFSIGILF